MLAAFGGLLLLITIVMVYFAPAAIAVTRGHNNSMPIFLINLVLGWTFIGWFVALVWSSTSNVKS